MYCMYSILLDYMYVFERIYIKNIWVLLAIGKSNRRNRNFQNKSIHFYLNKQKPEVTYLLIYSSASIRLLMDNTTSCAIVCMAARTSQGSKREGGRAGRQGRWRSSGVTVFPPVMFFIGLSRWLPSASALSRRPSRSDSHLVTIVAR